jgi:protein-disulfide isomerase
MLKKALTTATFAAIAAASLFAATAQAANNPLHPSYFQDKAANSVQPIVTGDTVRYVDVGNPLSPSYNRAGDATWMVTSDVNVVAYVDIRNPLSPSYKR